MTSSHSSGRSTEGHSTRGQTSPGGSSPDHAPAPEEWLGPDDPAWTCPECQHCVDQPDCYDCLDCMTPGGSAAVEQQLRDAPAQRVRHLGPADPLPTSELEARRAALGLVDHLVHAVRAARGEAGLSQRGLAALLGWSKSRVHRFEADPGKATVLDAAAVLARCGYQLAVVQDGVPLSPTAWGTTELVAHDSAGRRFPPYAVLTAGPGEASGHRRGPDGQHVVLDWRWRHPTSR